MGILEQIEKIQQKPKRTRLRILIASVTLTMAVVVTIWIQTMHSTFSSNRKSEAQEIIQPFSLLWGMTKDGFGDLKSQLQNLKLR